MSDWSRLRTITAGFEGFDFEEEHLVNRVYYEIASGIVDKLREHKKWQTIKLGNGIIRVTCSLDILVPYPSVPAIPSMRSPE